LSCKRRTKSENRSKRLCEF